METSINENKILKNILLTGSSSLPNIYVDNNIVLLSSEQIAKLFRVGNNKIQEHINNIIKDGEFRDEAIVRCKVAEVEDDKNILKDCVLYNLQMVIAIGCRLDSVEGIKFRIWMNKCLTEFARKGFILDDERLKEGSESTEIYFNELIERIEAIRASDLVFDKKITTFLTQCSIDYNPNDDTAGYLQCTIAVIKDKLFRYVTGMSEHELKPKRIKYDRPDFGLTTWKNYPTGEIMARDLNDVRNFLTEEETKELNEITCMILDYAESRAERKLPTTMEEWSEKIDKFLKFHAKSEESNGKQNN